MRVTMGMTVAGWLRTNLFSSPLNAALTAGALLLLFVTVPPLIDWAFVAADFSGETRNDCSRDGACWVFVKMRFWQFVYGFYPAPERWRVDVAFVALAGAVMPLFSERVRRRPRLSATLVVIGPAGAIVLFAGGVAGLAAVETAKWGGLMLTLIVAGVGIAASLPIGIVLALVLFAGGIAGLAEVETARWGGLMLTLIVAGVGIAASLPIGIALALGRASGLAAIRALSIAFIELWRGVPLITVLFMAAVMLPLFLPEGVTMNKLIRALIGVSLFAGAYMAEVVRGGLEAVPRGQVEAALSLGLSHRQTLMRIVIPQALRVIVPPLTNQYLNLTKNSSLAAAGSRSPSSSPGRRSRSSCSPAASPDSRPWRPPSGAG